MKGDIKQPTRLSPSIEETDQSKKHEIIYKKLRNVVIDNKDPTKKEFDPKAIEKYIAYEKPIGNFYKAFIIVNRTDKTSNKSNTETSIN